MSRKSSEEWEREQSKDGVESAPINLHSFEHYATQQDLENMLIFEHGKADYRKVSDIELCSLIDSITQDKYVRHSVYQLSQKEKKEIAEDLYKKFRIPEAQIRRCLIL